MKIGMVLYYDPITRYSVNSLAASIDNSGLADLFLVQGFDKLFEITRFVIDKYDVCIIGFSLQTYMLTNDNFLNNLLLFNKMFKEKCIKIAGGPHPSGDPLGALYSLGFDIAFIGESEKTIVNFLEEMINNGDIYRVKGLFLKNDDNYFYTGKPEPINLDDYPPYPYWRYLFNPIEITRGCPYGCKYCQVSYMHGFKMRHRSIEKIIHYLKYFISVGLRDIRFISPDSLGYGLKYLSREPRIDLVEELLSRIYKEYVSKHRARIFYGTFPSEVRPEHFTEEAARVLKKYVSNKEIIMGAQTGSNDLLKRIGRRHSIEDVYNAVEIAVKYGFTPVVDYIIGLPGETREDLLQTLVSIKKLVSMGAKIHLHVFMPLPGSPFGYAEPGRVPDWFKREISKVIGAGRAYGQWIHQERIARKIHELRMKGIIMPRRGRIHAAPGINTGSSVPP